MSTRPPSHASAAPASATDFGVTLTVESFVPYGVFASVEIGVSSPAREAPREPFETHGLHEAELAFAASLPTLQSAGFIAGRRALRAALGRIAPDTTIGPLLRTHRGAPTLPTGLTGSISHKRSRAIAVAAPSDGDVLGVDLEARPQKGDPLRRSIAQRILTASERERLDGLDAWAHHETTLVHFALKEAVYKSIDPYVGRYVRFTEVELDVGDDGFAMVRLLLPESSVQEVAVEAHWRFEGHWIIAMAQSHRP